METLRPRSFAPSSSFGALENVLQMARVARGQLRVDGNWHDGDQLPTLFTELIEVDWPLPFERGLRLARLGAECLDDCCVFPLLHGFDLLGPSSTIALRKP